MRWCLTALDPFHDYQQNIEGYPDLNALPSVCQMYTTTVTVTAPAAAGAGTWDCNVMFTGLDCASTSLQTLMLATRYHCVYDHAALPTALGVAPMTILSDAAGVDLTLHSATAERDYLYTRQNASDMGRLIAVGYEVHNTTAEIYKQGTVVTAMIPSERIESSDCTYFDTNGAPWSSVGRSCILLPCYPSDEAQVRQIPSSGQWAAAKGCYVVPRIINMNNVPQPSYGKSGITYHTLPEGVAGAAVYQTAPTTNSTFGGIVCPASNGTTDSIFGATCSYFTGLSNQTTLTITLRSVVEYFPYPGSALLPAATPSPAYDPVSLQLYSLAVREAPYAVPVAQNSAGDFFRKILRVISNVAPVVGAMLPSPAAQGILSGVGMAAGAGSTLLEQRKAKKVARETAGAQAQPSKR